MTPIIRPRQQKLIPNGTKVYIKDKTTGGPFSQMLARPKGSPNYPTMEGVNYVGWVKENRSQHYGENCYVVVYSKKKLYGGDYYKREDLIVVSDEILPQELFEI